MATRTVYMDKHGLYVRENGVIWRPQINHFYRPMNRPSVASKFGVGDKVKVRGLYDMQYIKVGDEYWYYHGSYSIVYRMGDELKIKKLKSVDCWEG